MNIIDPHIHLFNLQLGEYQWLKNENPPFWSDKETIQRDFSTADLKLPDIISLKGVIHIEAGFDNEQPHREVEWLESNYLTHLDQHADKIKGKTIASIDLTLTDELFDRAIEHLSTFQSVIGVRHILDDDAVKLLGLSQVQRNLQKLALSSYIFECQLEGTDTNAILLLTKVLDTTPNLKLIINHAAFPSIDSKNFETWQQNMRSLSLYKNVLVKASGWEMINRKYNQQTINTIVQMLINIFTSNNVMLASNFPLCLFSNSYAELWRTYMLLDIDEKKKEKLMYLNAKKHYQL